MQKCKGSFYQERSVDISKLGVGGKLLILRHAECDCNTGCRRVTLWHPVPRPLDDLDEFAVKAIARVRWGDGCGGPEAEIDWKHGVILDLSGCYDEVALEIVEILGAAPDEDVPFRYGVLSACCGAGAARGCATRTTEQFTTATGVGIPIPPFAYAVQFVPVPASAAAFFGAGTTVFQTGSGFGATALMTSAAGNAIPDPWALINGAERIAVTVAEEVTFEVVFLIGV